MFQRFFRLEPDGRATKGIGVRQIQIVGGGIGGLALGIRLRQCGVPVMLTEAASYPRHKVCGEFLSGSGQQVIKTMDEPALLTAARSNRNTAWFAGKRMVFARNLPVPALGLSRFQLDRRLAEHFEALGGCLRRGTTVKPGAAPGTVQAMGRRRGSGQLLGLKVHCLGFRQTHDLSMHFGTHGYVGVARVEEGRSNICGLFRIRRGLNPGKIEMMDAYLRANQLNELADAMAGAEIDPDSITATVASDFSSHSGPADGVSIGDCHTAIPPFAGNGMSMALESAEAALPHLLRYAAGEAEWAEIARQIHRDLSRRFRGRLLVSRSLHPLLFQPRGRRPVEWAIASHLLPFGLIFRLLR